MSKAWEDKANKVIQRLCKESRDSTNTRKDGKQYKQHKSYSIPEDAEELIECLATDNEEQAKYIFLTRGY